MSTPVEERQYEVKDVDCCFTCRHVGVWTHFSRFSHHCTLLVENKEIAFLAPETKVNILGYCNRFEKAKK